MSKWHTLNCNSFKNKYFADSVSFDFLPDPGLAVSGILTEVKES